MKRTVIRGTGRYLPPRVVTNEDMTQWMDTSDEWIRQRTGIEQRHWVPEAGGVGSSDLGSVTTELVVGVPVRRILEVAERLDARLIVMGSRGRTGLSHLLLGSKAQSVVQLAAIPVTIVKADEDMGE